MRKLNVISKFIAITCIILGLKNCKQDDKEDQYQPAEISKNQSSSIDQVSNQEKKGFALVDYSLDTTSYTKTEAQTIPLNISEPKDIENEKYDILGIKDFNDIYALSDSVITMVEEFKVTLADVTPSGRFYDVKNKTFLNTNNNAEKCYSAVYENYSEIFFLRELPNKIEPLFALVDSESEIVISGEICLLEGGKISTFKNNGLYSLSKNGLENFISILQTRNVKFKENTELALSANPFSWLFKKAFKRSKKSKIDATPIPTRVEINPFRQSEEVVDLPPPKKFDTPVVEAKTTLHGNLEMPVPVVRRS